MSELNILPSPHAEAAKALLDKIRALRAEVPRFVTEVPPRERRRLVPPAAVPPAVMESASVAIQSSERLAAAAATDAATLRDTYSYALAYEAVARELQAFAASVTHTVRVQRAAAGASALDVLALARRLARQKDGAELLPHVADMQRKLNRGRGRKAATKAPELPTSPDAERSG
jgi:hypothetical protein